MTRCKYWQDVAQSSRTGSSHLKETILQTMLDIDVIVKSKQVHNVEMISPSHLHA